MVGAIVLDARGRCVGRGFHAQAGEAHAEIVALREAGDRARGGTLFVTLEPCTVHGRTPPCVDAVIAAGPRRVVVAAKDPNPRVDGEGIAKLREAGIDVTVGVLEFAARKLNRPFEKNIVHGAPFLRAKLARSYDGIVGSHARRVRISDPMMERTTMRLRAEADAILVGVGTVQIDDPLLTVRDARYPARTPVRIVLDPHLRTPPQASLFKEPGEVWLIHGPGANLKPLESLKNVTFIELPLDPKGQLDTKALMGEWKRRSIRSVLVEGGPTTLGRLWGHIDEWVIYVHDAPLLDLPEPVFADLGRPLHLSIDSVVRRAHDWEIVAHVHRDH